MLIETDAFSLGQIDSKLWAAEKLEECVKEHSLGPLNMYILGGWYALLFFILKIRNNITVSNCRSVDLDSEACHIANILNNTWESKDWQFRAFPDDVNVIAYPDSVNCIINTSAEHIESMEWWERIPVGTVCLIQSNNLDIPEHVATVETLDELVNKFPMAKTLYSGSNALPDYTRFMIIGIK
jgi:hypothetical protein